MAFTDQAGFDIRCEWGAEGVAALSGCRTFIVVDVLSFSSCVSVAMVRGVTIFPYPYQDANGAADLAQRHQATLAGRRGDRYSLSPASLLAAPAGTRLVLPSPNGATIALQARDRGHVLAGCLRNVSATCARAVALGGPVAVIPAGERWADGRLRPAYEDLVGAGAIAAMLPGRPSPDAAAAIGAFRSAAHHLAALLSSCASGREMADGGFAEDVRLAAELDTDELAAELVGDRFG